MSSLGVKVIESFGRRDVFDIYSVDVAFVRVIKTDKKGFMGWLKCGNANIGSSNVFESKEEVMSWAEERAHEHEKEYKEKYGD